MAVNNIEVTDVIVFPLRKAIKDSKLKAFARIIINDQFIINGVKIFEGCNDEPFLRFPQSGNNETEKSYDICFPIAAELREYITDQVLTQYAITINAHS